MLGNFSYFCCLLQTLFKIFFFQKILSGTLSNCLDPDQDRQNVGPDLDPNRLQRLSATTNSVASKERVKYADINIQVFGSLISS